jgi:hypothetical protein
MEPELLRYLPLVIVCVLLLRRTRRPRTIRPSRLWALWITPAVLLLVATLYVVGAIRYGARLDLTGGFVVATALAGGIALGALRAHTVRLARHPDTGAIEATLTAWGLLLLLAWVMVRVLLRQSGLIGDGAPFGIFSDAMLALGIGAVCAQAVVLTQRCRALVH